MTSVVTRLSLGCGLRRMSGTASVDLIYRGRCMGPANRLVLWDFDGTLGYRPGMWSQTLIDSLSVARAGHGFGAADIRPYLGSGFPWQSRALHHPFAGDPDAWWGQMTLVFRHAFVSMGCSTSDAHVASLLVREQYLDPSRWIVYSDSAPSLDRLARAGWKSSIVSNHVPELPELIQALGLADKFAHIVSSGSLGWEKPSRSIFAHAVELAGSPSAVHMIGDNLAADVRGAENAGITGHLLERGPDSDPSRSSPLEIVVERILATG